MKIGLAIASLAFCVATSVSFAAAPAPRSAPAATPAATPATTQSARPANALHCAKGEFAHKGKCVTAKPKH